MSDVEAGRPGSLSASGFSRVGVVGGGLIGGSIALRLHQRGIGVVVADTDPATRSAVEAAGLRAAVGVDELEGCDLVIVATPLDVVPAALRELAGWTQAVVVDVGSVKQAPRAAAEAAGLAGRYVGLHPMSGTEHAGFAHASADLVSDVTWAACRGPGDADAQLLTRLVAWVAAVFDATVVVLDAAEHDRAVAAVSQLPHLVANALLGVVAGSDAPGSAVLAAGSFRDGTRVAGTHPDRTRNMVAENAQALLPLLDALIDQLGAYRTALADDDPTAGLGGRLAAVADAAARFRHPTSRWEPGDDAVLATRLADPGSGLLVRGEPGAWQTAPLS